MNEEFTIDDAIDWLGIQAIGESGKLGKIIAWLKELRDRGEIVANFSVSTDPAMSLDAAIDEMDNEILVPDESGCIHAKRPDTEKMLGWLKELKNAREQSGVLSLQLDTDNHIIELVRFDHKDCGAGCRAAHLASIEVQPAAPTDSNPAPSVYYRVVSKALSPYLEVVLAGGGRGTGTHEVWSLGKELQNV
jgi:hypothetical protein